MKNIDSNEIAGLLLGKYDEASELNIDFKIDPEASLEKKTSNDFCERLVTIIGNLIDNAIESFNNFDNKKENKKIYLNISENKDFLKIIVKDNGKGMDKSTKARIFDRDFTTKKGKVHGVGLDIVKKNIDILNGNIEIESKPKKGTKFTILIPYN